MTILVDTALAGHYEENTMSNRDEKVERELARERHERALHDEARAGLAPVEEEFRLKDARERGDTCNLKRQAGR